MEDKAFCFTRRTEHTLRDRSEDVLREYPRKGRKEENLQENSPLIRTTKLQTKLPV